MLTGSIVDNAFMDFLMQCYGELRRIGCCSRYYKRLDNYFFIYATEIELMRYACVMTP